jgi:catechol 2,3-dioxygenase-like lactoylglutathione lyase family enzyme
MIPHVPRVSPCLSSVGPARSGRSSTILVENLVQRLFVVALLCALGGFAAAQVNKSLPPSTTRPGEKPMRLGNFSVSLAVKDLAASRAFYEKLDFRVKGGDADKNWLILQSDTATIGLFQGMLDRNTLTFNPGWDRSGAALADFDDVRDIQRELRDRGLTPAPAADETTSGPAFLMLTDPDGNPILIDQHVSRPKKK